MYIEKLFYFELLFLNADLLDELFFVVLKFEGSFLLFLVSFSRSTRAKLIQLANTTALCVSYIVREPVNTHYHSFVNRPWVRQVGCKIVPGMVMEIQPLILLFLI